MGEAVSPDGHVMSVDTDLGATFNASIPKALFQMSGYAGQGAAGRYSVAKDNRRFLFGLRNTDAEAAPLEVVLNWTARLRK
jgi:hypothetical protein